MNTDYTILDQKIKSALLIIKVRNLETQREDILNSLSMETTTEEETLKCVRSLKAIESDLSSAKLDLELIGIDVSRSN